IDLLLTLHQLKGPGAVFHGFLPLAQTGVGAGAVTPGEAILGVQFKGFGEVGDGLFELTPAFVMKDPVVPGRWFLRVQFGAPGVRSEGLLWPATLAASVAQLEPDSRIFDTGVQRGGDAEIVSRRMPLLQLVMSAAAAKIGFGVKRHERAG